MSTARHVFLGVLLGLGMSMCLGFGARGHAALDPQPPTLVWDPVQIPVIAMPNVTAIRFKNNNVFLKWDPVDYADGYFVIRVSGGKARAFGPSTADAFEFMDANAPADADYYVKGFVEVLDVAKDASKADVVQAQPSEPEPPASPPAMPDTSWGADRHHGYPADWINVGWTATGNATSFKVRCKLAGVSDYEEKLAGLSCRCTFSGLSPSQDAFIQIVPCNKGGEGPATPWREFRRTDGH